MMGGVECPIIIILKFIACPRRGTRDEVRTQKLKTQIQISMKIKVMTALQQDAAGEFSQVSWYWEIWGLGPGLLNNWLVTRLGYR